VGGAINYNKEGSICHLLHQFEYEVQHPISIFLTKNFNFLLLYHVNSFLQFNFISNNICCCKCIDKYSITGVDRLIHFSSDLYSCALTHVIMSLDDLHSCLSSPFIPFFGYMHSCVLASFIPSFGDFHVAILTPSSSDCFTPFDVHFCSSVHVTPSDILDPIVNLDFMWVDDVFGVSHV